MFLALHDSIKQLILDQGRLPTGEVDVTFETPARAWVDSLTCPTINLFLFDLSENTELRHPDMQAGRGNGRTSWRMPPRRFDLRYLVGAFSSFSADEHLLLWRTLATLLKHPQFPPAVLAVAMREIMRRRGALGSGEPIAAAQGDTLTSANLRAFAEAIQVDGWSEERVHRLKAELLALVPDPPLTTQIVKPDEGPRLIDLWSALDLPPRPALLYTVTAPLDLELEFVAPLVLTRTLRYTRSTPVDEATGAGISPGRVVTIDSSVQIAGVVRDRGGQPVAGAAVGVEGRALETIADHQGRFTLARLERGRVTLWATREGGRRQSVPIEIPSEAYDITLDEA
jgi:hypothetical protein